MTLRSLAAFCLASTLVACGINSEDRADPSTSHLGTSAAPLVAANAQDAGTCGPFGDPPATLTGTQYVPNCNADGGFAGQPIGQLLPAWPDPEGTPRYACLWTPSQASASNPLPLVIFLHASATSADSVYSLTNLLTFIDSTTLSGNPARPGFLVLAPEGRNTTHYYASFDNQGLGWDIWYRQFSAQAVTVGGVSYPANVDFAAIDHFVAEAVASGLVDPSRIYVTGWSNGAAASVVYGLFRSHVTAIGPYSGNPFCQDANDTDPCQQTPVVGAPANDSQLQIPRVGLPIFNLHNACDIGGSCDPNAAAVAHLASLGENTTDTVIDLNQNQVQACDPVCEEPNESQAALAVGVTNHCRWPSDWTKRMLCYFATL